MFFGLLQGRALPIVYRTQHRTKLGGCLLTANCISVCAFLLSSNHMVCLFVCLFVACYETALLGTFTKLWKVTISFIMSVCPSVSVRVWPHGTTWLPLDEFSWNLIFEYLSKFVRKIQVSLKSEEITGTLHEDLRIFMIRSKWILLRMRNVSGKSCSEKLKHKFFVRFLLKNCSVYEIWGKIW